MLVLKKALFRNFTRSSLKLQLKFFSTQSFGFPIFSPLNRKFSSELSNKYYQKGLINLDDYDFNQALENFKNCLQVQKEHLDSKDPSFIETYYKLAETYRKNDNCDEAINMYQNIEKLQDNLKFSKRDKETTFTMIGSLSYFNGDYEKAIEYYKKLIDVTEEDEVKFDAYKFIAYSYNRMEKFDEALNYFKIVLRMIENSRPKSEEICIIYREIGIIYFRKKEYGEAINYFLQCKEIQEEILDPKHFALGITYLDLSRTYIKLRKVLKSIEFYKKSLDIQEIDPISFITQLNIIWLSLPLSILISYLFYSKVYQDSSSKNK